MQQSAIDYGDIPIPALTGTAAVVGGENLFLMKTSPEREKAGLEFLEYTLGEEFQTAWACGSGIGIVQTVNSQQSTVNIT